MTTDRDRILVVGGASGIGAAAAASFSTAGADVTVADIKPSADHEMHYVHCDLADSASIDTGLGDLEGPWDAVIHVAGIPGTAPDDAVVGVNFLGLRKFVTAIAPKVKRGGAIVVVASTAGSAWPYRMAEISGLLDTGTFEDGRDWYAANKDDYAAYNLSKEAVLAFVKRFSSFAWSRYGVRVNAVSPGPTETPILADFEQSMGKELLDGVREQVGRHATPADIAPVIAFLAGPAAGWVMGQDLQVDGGFVAGMSAGVYSEEQLADQTP